MERSQKINKKFFYKELRQQIAGYDCVPTAFINALIYLFKREEIPIDVVQGIYKKTLNGKLDWGSTSADIKNVAKFLKGYRCRKDGWNFAVDIDHQVGKRIDFSKIDLESDKVCCVLRVKIAGGFPHYITAFYEKGDYIYCYDPYSVEQKETRNWRLKKMRNGCNLRIKREYLFAEKDNGVYRTLVSKNHDKVREFILIKRIKPAR